MGFWSLEMIRFQSGDWQSLKVNPSESLASVKVETCGTCPKKSINSWYLQSSQPGPTGPKICNSDLQLNYKYKRLARFSRFCLWSTTAWMLQQKDFFWNILDQLRSPPALGWPKERQVWKCSTILPSRPGRKALRFHNTGENHRFRGTVSWDEFLRIFRVCLAHLKKTKEDCQKRKQIPNCQSSSSISSLFTYGRKRIIIHIDVFRFYFPYKPPTTAGGPVEKKLHLSESDLLS